MTESQDRVGDGQRETLVTTRCDESPFARVEFAAIPETRRSTVEALEPDVGNRFAARLSDLLEEVATEKREARERAAREATRRETLPGRLWLAFAQHGTSVSLIVTIFSGIVAGAWSVKRYLDQQTVESAQRQREYEFEQRRTIATFAGDLSDPAKRNGAAYALATVAGEAAIPLLFAHLRAAAANDEPFRDALALALSEIGEPVLDDVVRLNREGTDAQGFTKPTVIATQQIIVSLIARRIPALLDSTARLNGVVLPSADLGFTSLDRLNLGGIKFRSVDFCSASLQRTSLRQVEIIESARFMNARLRGADMREIRVLSEFGLFKGVDFQGADLTDANLTGAKLRRADFSEASLVRTNLTSADLYGADLSFANLTDADLKDVRVVTSQSDPPYLRDPATFVWGANISGAKNVDERLRTYLCRYGALNVPGGCVGIGRLEAMRKTQSGFAESCF